MGQERIGRLWRFYFRSGNAKHQSRAVYPTKTAAREAEAEARRKAKGIPRKDSTDLTFLTICELALDRWTELDHDSEWIRTKKYVIKRYFQEWLPMKWTDVSKEVISKKMLALKSEVSPEASNRYLKMLRAIFNVALSKDLISYNPAKGIDFFPNTQKRRREYNPTPDEVDRILLVAEPTDQRFIICVYHLLARVFEVFRMEWKDVDFRKDTVILWTRKKSDHSYYANEVPMNADAKDALTWIKRRSDPNNPYVFPNPGNGKPYVRRPKVLKSLCAKAGVRPFIWRGLRKCSATEMYYEKDIPLLTISSLLAHESIETTRIYLGISDERKRDAVDAISRKCPKSAPQKQEKALTEPQPISF